MPQKGQEIDLIDDIGLDAKTSIKILNELAVEEIDKLFIPLNHQTKACAKQRIQINNINDIDNQTKSLKWLLEFYDDDLKLEWLYELNNQLTTDTYQLSKDNSISQYLSNPLNFNNRTINEMVAAVNQIALNHADMIIKHLHPKFNYREIIPIIAQTCQEIFNLKIFKHDNKKMMLFVLNKLLLDYGLPLSITDNFININWNDRQSIIDETYMGLAVFKHFCAYLCLPSSDISKVINKNPFLHHFTNETYESLSSEIKTLFYYEKEIINFLLEKDILSNDYLPHLSLQMFACILENTTHPLQTFQTLYQKLGAKYLKVFLSAYPFDNFNLQSINLDIVIENLNQLSIQNIAIDNLTPLQKYALIKTKQTHKISPLALDYGDFCTVAILLFDFSFDDFSKQNGVDIEDFAEWNILALWRFNKYLIKKDLNQIIISDKFFVQTQAYNLNFSIFNELEQKTLIEHKAELIMFMEHHLITWFDLVQIPTSHLIQLITIIKGLDINEVKLDWESIIDANSFTFNKKMQFIKNNKHLYLANPPPHPNWQYETSKTSYYSNSEGQNAEVSLSQNQNSFYNQQYPEAVVNLAKAINGSEALIYNIYTKDKELFDKILLLKLYLVPQSIEERINLSYAITRIKDLSVSDCQKLSICFPYTKEGYISEKSILSLNDDEITILKNNLANNTLEKAMQELLDFQTEMAISLSMAIT